MLPVLVLVHRRTRSLETVLHRIREGNPSRLYVSGDAPRPGHPDDDQRVGEVWNFLESQQFDFPVYFQRLDQHGGLSQGVESGITWFFSREEAGIVLEDDVLIDPKSLQLATDVGRHFREWESVGSFTLFNPVPRRRLANPDRHFRFSNLPSSLFWGSWSSRWTDVMKLEVRELAWLTEGLLATKGDERFVRYWLARKELIVGGKESVSWEMRFLLAHWLYGWRVVSANDNHAVHIGFDLEATNSKHRPRWHPTKLGTYPESSSALAAVSDDAGADRWLSEKRFGLSRRSRARQLLKAFVADRSSCA